MHPKRTVSTPKSAKKPGTVMPKPKTPVKSEQNAEEKVKPEASETQLAAATKHCEVKVKHDTLVKKEAKELINETNFAEVSIDVSAIDDSVMENEVDLEEMDEDQDKLEPADESFDIVEEEDSELFADMDEEEFSLMEENAEDTHQADIFGLQEDLEEVDQREEQVSSKKEQINKVKEKSETCEKLKESEAVDEEVKKDEKKNYTTSVKEEVKKKEEDEVKPATNPVIRPNLKQVLANDTNIIEIVIGRYATTFDKEMCLNLVEQWKSEKLEMTLVELLKRFEEQEGALTLNSNALFKAKQAQNRKRRVLKVSDIPKAFGKEGVQNLFSQFGKVLAFSFVGIRYPLESVLLTMDTEESCNSAIAALDGKPVEGYPKNKVSVRLNSCAGDIKIDSIKETSTSTEPRELKGSRQNRPAGSEREKSRDPSPRPKRSSIHTMSTEKSKIVDEQLDKLTSDLLDFYKEKKDWVYNHLKRVFGERLLKGSTIPKKNLVSEALRTPYAIVKDSSVECADWKEDRSFVTYVKTTNVATKRLWEVVEYFVGHLDYFSRNFKEILKKGKEMSVEKIVNLVVQNHPEVQPKPETIKKFDLPDISYQWILIDNLPPNIGADQLKKVIRKTAMPERVVMLRRQSPSAVVKMISTKAAEVITVKLQGRMLPGSQKNLLIRRYTGAFAQKDKHSNKKSSSTPEIDENENKETVKKEGKEMKNKTEEKGPVKQKKPGQEKKSSAEKKPTPANERTEVLIDKLPVGFDLQKLKERISNSGDVKAVHPIKGGTKCFVEMKTRTGAQKVIKDFNGSTIEGSTDKIRAVFCKRKKEHKTPVDAEKEAPKKEKESKERSPSSKAEESESKPRSNDSSFSKSKQTSTSSTHKRSRPSTASFNLKRKAPMSSSVPSKRFANRRMSNVPPLLSDRSNTRAAYGNQRSSKSGYGSDAHQMTSNSLRSIANFGRGLLGAAPHSATISSINVGNNNHNSQVFGSGCQDFGLSRGMGLLSSNQAVSSQNQGFGMRDMRRFGSGNQGFSGMRVQQHHQFSSGSFSENRQQHQSSLNLASNRHDQMHFNLSRSGNQQDFGNNQRSHFQQKSGGLNKNWNQDITGISHRDTLGNGQSQQEQFRGEWMGSSEHQRNQWSRSRDDERMKRLGYADRQRRHSPQGRSYDRSRSRSPVGHAQGKSMDKLISDVSVTSGMSSDQMKMMMLTLSSMMVQSMKNKKEGSEGQEKSRASEPVDWDDHDESFIRRRGMDDRGGRGSVKSSTSFSRDQGGISAGSHSMMGGKSYLGNSGDNYMVNNQQNQSSLLGSGSQWSQGSGGSGRSIWGSGFSGVDNDSQSTTLFSSGSQYRSNVPSLTSINTAPAQNRQRQGLGQTGNRGLGFQQGGRGKRRY